MSGFPSIRAFPGDVLPPELPALLRSALGLSCDPVPVAFQAAGPRRRGFAVYDAGGIGVVARFEPKRVAAWCPDLPAAAFAEFNSIPFLSGRDVSKAPAVRAARAAVDACCNSFRKAWDSGDKVAAEKFRAATNSARDALIAACVAAAGPAPALSI